MKNNIIQWKDIKSNQKVATQVCIIGTGCGGATLGAQLVKQGIDVILIDQGGYYPTAAFDNNELNMAGKLSGDRNLATSSDNGINLMYGNNIGGASVHYWADSYRTPVDRLQYWEEEFGIENHDVNRLSKYWDELDVRLNVHPATDAYLNPMNRLVEKGARNLGWKGHRVPQARKNCQKSGHCMQGCAFGAKQSQLVTHIEDILEAGGRIYSDLKAEQLIYKNGKVESLRSVSIDRPSGKETSNYVEIKASAFVVAAGGYGSSTFLLRNGLKKQLPALGEFIGMNPSPIVHAMYPWEVNQWRNIPAGFGIDHFRLAEYDAKGNYLQGGYLLMPNQLQPATLSALIPVVGDEHFNWIKNLSNLGGTIGWIDDVPTELGRIHLSGKDRKVDYKIGKTTSLILKDLLRKQVMLNFAAGAEKVLIGNNQATLLHSIDDLGKIDNLTIDSGSLMMAAPHPSGGCRMGKDPKITVTNSEHKVHGFTNLFVADSSVFPTGVSVDPSYTIMAFSYAAADSIAEYLA
ncbi:MAG: GMC family oxidoreductase [Leptospira sp.]|nr:GMC family oxidoreductase [Leptospira sp.]